MFLGLCPTKTVDNTEVGIFKENINKRTVFGTRERPEKSVSRKRKGNIFKCFNNVFFYQQNEILGHESYNSEDIFGITMSLVEEFSPCQFFFQIFL